MRTYRIQATYRLNLYADFDLEGWLIPFKELKQFEVDGVYLQVRRIVSPTPNDRALEIDVTIPYSALHGNEAKTRAYDILDSLRLLEVLKTYVIIDAIDGRTVGMYQEGGVKK